MRVLISMMQIDRIEETAAGRSTVCENLFRDPPVRSRIVECAKLDEVKAATAEFVAEVEASGHCARVFTHDKSPRGVRAISGFKKLESSSQRGILVNEAVGLAAGKAVA